ncbi:DUF488 domain-containing protein [Nocardioides marmoribigeumensis]|uniref:Uncharacterized protein (DUF488 family) n=1 Tax=Nocardioides marmoribigeumensis TaxID=433649 RepID=A0ABU2BZD2_9ACTN|nr:DUF488 domain-containing protein [Nocardioides marmoribigeumensis]MDR7363729.1 uncharacterized protein (DUF488 family) [Nocardioides marmoribigeumensis]
MLLTFGHGTATPDDLVALLSDAGVGRVVDVRRFPGSRRQPDLAREAMEVWLPAAGIAYRWEPRLGGRRRIPVAEDDRDRWWRVTAFRAYAAHMRTDEFREGLAAVLPAADPLTAVMCSESLWWRCHRRLVADAAVLLHGLQVEHLGHDGRRTVHVPPESATVVGQDLVYPADASG